MDREKAVVVVKRWRRRRVVSCVEFSERKLVGVGICLKLVEPCEWVNGEVVIVGLDVEDNVSVGVRVCGGTRGGTRGGRMLGSILDISTSPGLSSGVPPHALASDLGALW